MKWGTLKYFRFHVCKENMKYKYAIKPKRFLYKICNNLFWFLLVISCLYILIFDLFLTFREVKYVEERDCFYKKFLDTICYTYIATFIFVLCSEKLPNFRKYISAKKHIKATFTNIKNTLANQIRTLYVMPFSFSTYHSPTKIEFVNKFIYRAINQSQIFNKLIAQIHIESENIRTDAKDLLKFYGNQLNFEEINKLEYLLKFYNIPQNIIYIPYTHSPFKEINYELGPIKEVALKIYCTYEVFHKKKFEFPLYDYDGFEDFSGYHLKYECKQRCLLFLNGWCMGEYEYN